MNEIEKLYKNIGIKPKYSGWLDMGDLDTQMTYIQCDTKEEWDECVFMSRSSYSDDDENYDTPRMEYPPFTAEKQIEIVKVISTNRISDDYEYKYLGIDQDAINREWYLNLCCIDGIKYHVHDKDFAIVLAKLVNLIWQDLTEEEKQQVKGILE